MYIVNPWGPSFKLSTATKLCLQIKGCFHVVGLWIINVRWLEDLCWLNFLVTMTADGCLFEYNNYIIFDT